MMRNTVQILKGEVHKILTLMRLNARWGSRHRFQEEIPLQDENHLTQAFRLLTDQLEGWSEVYEMDSLMYVEPFLEVVVSKDTNGLITSSALSSLNKFISYQFLTPNSPNIAITIGKFAKALPMTRFEDTSREVDEMVLMNLLDLCSLLVHSEVGKAYLGEEEKWELFLCCFRIPCGEGVDVEYEEGKEDDYEILNVTNGVSTISDIKVSSSIRRREMVKLVKESSNGKGVSNLLKVSASNALAHIVLSVFNAQEDDDEIKKNLDSIDLLNMKLEDNNNNNNNNSNSKGLKNIFDPIQEDEENLELPPPPPPLPKGGLSNEYNKIVRKRTGSNESVPAPILIMQFLALLIDPQISDNANIIRGLSLLNIALEAGGQALSKLPKIVTVMQTDICKYLLQDSQLNDLPILSLTLRVVLNLFNSIKDHLKVQLEVFLTSIHLRILASPSSPPEHKELALESLIEFTKEPALMHDIYINYDCDMNCTNLFEAICTTLSSKAIPNGFLGLSISNVTDSLNQNQLIGNNNELNKNQLTSPHRLSSASFPYIENEQNNDLGTLNNNNDDNKTNRNFINDNLLSTDLEISFGKEYSIIHASAGQHANLTTLHRLALEGVLDVIHSISSRCINIDPNNNNHHHNMSRGNSFTFTAPTKPTKTLDNLRTLSFNESDLKDQKENGTFSSSTTWLQNTKERNDLILQQRKNMKRKIALVIQFFNKDDIKDGFPNSPKVKKNKSKNKRKDKIKDEDNKKKKIMKQQSSSSSSSWIQYAQELGVLPSPVADEVSVAKFLKSTHGLNRTFIGEFLSKGPPEEYPFNASVLEAYLKEFEFKDQPFDVAFRSFLQAFRLPGEAQCIDRLMEAFAKEFYEVNKEIIGSIFKSADCVFILSFSTVMLNTDLHNPNLAEEKRMTIDEWYKNNRGINDGDDLPRDFLKSIYYSIKNSEIEVDQDLTSISNQGASATNWDGLLRRGSYVSSATFTPAAAARKQIFHAGVHDKEMFESFNESAFLAMTVIFENTSDGLLLLKCLEGFKEYSQICFYYKKSRELNAVVTFLIGHGMEQLSDMLRGYSFGKPPENIFEHALLKNIGLLINDNINDSDENRNDNDENFKYRRRSKKFILPSLDDLHGYCQYRRLIGLGTAFEIIGRNPDAIQFAWSQIIYVLFAFCNCNALPLSLADVDDFGDENGAPLPPSIFAKLCAQTHMEYALGRNSKKEEDQSIWKSLSSIFWSNNNNINGSNNDNVDNKRVLQNQNSSDVLNQQLIERHPISIEHLREISMILIQFTKAIPFENLFLNTRLYNFRTVIYILKSLLSQARPKVLYTIPLHGAQFGTIVESHSILALEISSRIILANQSRAVKLWPFMHSFLKEILITRNQNDVNNSYHHRSAINHYDTGNIETDDEIDLTLPNNPFLFERAIVTVLRACIHMIHRPELRFQLLESLSLISYLPSVLIPFLSDRLASGLLSLLRTASPFFLDGEIWIILVDLLKRTSYYLPGQHFVIQTLNVLIERQQLYLYNTRPIISFLRDSIALCLPYRLIKMPIEKKYSFQNKDKNENNDNNNNTDANINESNKEKDVIDQVFENEEKEEEALRRFQEEERSWLLHPGMDPLTSGGMGHLKDKSTLYLKKKNRLHELIEVQRKKQTKFTVILKTLNDNNDELNEKFLMNVEESRSFRIKSIEILEKLIISLIANQEELINNEKFSNHGTISADPLKISSNINSSSDSDNSSGTNTPTYIPSPSTPLLSSEPFLLTQQDVGEMWLEALYTLIPIWHFSISKDIKDKVDLTIYNILLEPNESISATCWKECFHSLLFHLPTNISPFPALVLISKVLLHHSSYLSTINGFDAVWLKGLSLFSSIPSKYDFNIDEYERLIQIVGNLMMIMVQSGAIEEMRKLSGQDVLSLSWKLIDASIPEVRELLTQLAPDVLPENQNKISEEKEEIKNKDVAKDVDVNIHDNSQQQEQVRSSEQTENNNDEEENKEEKIVVV